MSESASIQKMSHKHEAILNFLIENPLLRMSEVAAAFEVTFPWLSTIVHSHAFQDQLARRQDELFDSAILQTVGDKLSAAAQVTLDAYLEKVPNLTADQLISANDKILNRLGYGSKPNGNGKPGDTYHFTQINTVDKDVLEEARGRIGENQVGAPDNPSALQDQRAGQLEGPIEVEGLVVRIEGEQETAG